MNVRRTLNKRYYKPEFTIQLINDMKLMLQVHWVCV